MAVLPSSGVVVVTWASSICASHWVYTCKSWFLMFFEENKKLRKYYYSSTKWIPEATTHFGGYYDLALILKEKKNIEITLVFVANNEETLVGVHQQ